MMAGASIWVCVALLGLPLSVTSINFLSWSEKTLTLKIPQDFPKEKPIVSLAVLQEPKFLNENFGKNGRKSATKYKLQKNPQKLFRLDVTENRVSILLSKSLEEFRSKGDVIKFQLGSEEPKELPLKINIKIIDSFNCNKIHKNMCLVPDEGIYLQEWENRSPQNLLLLPDLNMFCPDVQVEYYVRWLENASGPSYLDIVGHSLAFQTAYRLDREVAGNLVHFKLHCNVEINKKNETMSFDGHFSILDEDDSPPISEYDSLDVRMEDNYSLLYDKLLVFDADLNQTNTYALSIENDPAYISNLSTVTEYHLDKDSCKKSSRWLQSYVFNASCTVISPKIQFDGDAFENYLWTSGAKSVLLRLIYEDKTLITKRNNNKVILKLNLLPAKNVKHSPPYNAEYLRSIVPKLAPVTEIFISRPVSYMRITQLLDSHHLQTLVSSKSTTFAVLDKDSFGFGISVTQHLGIVYLSDPNILQGILAERRSVSIIVERNSEMFNITIKASTLENSCYSQLANEVLVAEGCAAHFQESSCTAVCALGGSGLCTWRPLSGGSGLTKTYATCSPDLSTCPDGVCDELEVLNFTICPQDCCMENRVHKSPNLKLNSQYNPPQGIAYGNGICWCNERCMCFPPVFYNTSVETDFEYEDDITFPDRNFTYVKAATSEVCGLTCQLAVAAVFVLMIVVLLLSVILCRDYTDDRSSSVTSGPTHGESHVSALYSIRSEHFHNFTNPEISPLTPNGVAISVDEKWEFPRQNLIIQQTLGEGEFGKVVKAKAIGINGSAGFSYVAVKMLKNNSTASELMDLMSEYDLLKEVSHPNVIKLLGACTSEGGPIYLIIEFCQYGSLRTYLRRSRHFEFEDLVGSAPVEGNYSVSPKEILSFAWQICTGMAYLADMKLVHRDLAARNVLLATDKVCKISDFGLTRDVYEGDLYFKRSKGRVPVKWMAIESLVDHVYTTKSDVWGFGVLLWELVTLGASPYPGISPEKLFTFLKAGNRMDRPNNCSSEMYNVMLKCWSEKPSCRPTFKELRNIFEEMIQTEAEYLELRSLMVTNKSYFGAPSQEREEITNNEMHTQQNTINQEESVREGHLSHACSLDMDSCSLTGAYAQAYREQSMEPLLTSGDSIMRHPRAQAHNPSYSSQADSAVRPPVLKYVTLAENTDDEESGNHDENQDAARSEEDYDSGRATVDSGYVTEECQKNGFSKMGAKLSPQLVDNDDRLNFIRSLSTGKNEHRAPIVV